MERSAAAPAPVELFPSRIFVGLFALMGAAFVGFGTALASGLLDTLASQPERTPNDPQISGAILIVLGAGFLLWFLPLLLWPRPSLVADGEGLHDRSRLGGHGSFAWIDVAAIGYARTGKHGGLGVWLRDPDRYLATRSLFVRPLLRLRNHFGRPVVRMTVLATRGSIRQFASDAGRAFGVTVQE